MNEKQNRKFEPGERLIEFVVLIIEIAESLNNTSAGNHISGQLLRSGASPEFQYGEAQSAESRNDLVHKLKILLKELRETLVALNVIKRVSLSKNMGIV